MHEKEKKMQGGNGMDEDHDEDWEGRSLYNGDSHKILKSDMQVQIQHVVDQWRNYNLWSQRH